LTKALQDRDDAEMDAYKEALRITARAIGTEKAIKLFRSNLKTENYTEAQINEMEAEARSAILQAQGAIPAGVGMKVYKAEADSPK